MKRQLPVQEIQEGIAVLERVRNALTQRIAQEEQPEVWNELISELREVTTTLRATADQLEDARRLMARTPLTARVERKTVAEDQEAEPDSVFVEPLERDADKLTK